MCLDSKEDGGVDGGLKQYLGVRYYGQPRVHPELHTNRSYAGRNSLTIVNVSVINIQRTKAPMRTLTIADDASQYFRPNCQRRKGLAFRRVEKVTSCQSAY